MWPTFVEILTARAAGKPGAAKDVALQVERRKRTRASVHWPVRLLLRGAPNGICTVTENLSSSGFYFLSPTPIAPGEPMVGILTAPAHDPGSEDRSISLECRGLVMRAEPLSNGCFGIACRIEHYHLIGNTVPET